MLAAAQAPNLVSGIALVAPVADSRIFTEGLSEKAIAEWRTRGRRRVGNGFLKPAFLDDVLRIDAQRAMESLAMPILVMHGSADDVVPPSHAERICRSVAGPCELETFDGVGHRFEEPGALDRLLTVLARWLATIKEK